MESIGRGDKERTKNVNADYLNTDNYRTLDADASETAMEEHPRRPIGFAKLDG